MYRFDGCNWFYLSYNTHIILANRVACWLELMPEHKYSYILYLNIDQKLLNSLHGLLNCEIGELDCHVFTTEYRTHVHCIHMYHLFVMHGSMLFIREYLFNARCLPITDSLISNVYKH